MDGHVLNGRQLEDWELPALERARQRDLDQAAELLAGVLAAEPVPRYAGRAVDDLPALP